MFKDNHYQIILTEEVMLYKETGDNFEALMQELQQIVYRYPVSKGLLSEEETSEFFIFFVPALPKLIDRYTFTGVPFIVFLFNAIDWQLKTFKTKKIEQDYEERLIYNQYFQDEYETQVNQYAEYAAEEYIDYEYETKIQEMLKKYEKESKEYKILNNLFYSKSGKRRLLYIALSFPTELTNEIRARLEALLGVPSEILYAWQLELIEAEQPTKKRLASLHKRLDILFRKLLFEEKKLSEEIFEAEQQKSRKAIITIKEDMEKLRKEIQESTICSKHKTIAEILEVPKGSVDSGLFYTRKSITSFVDHFC